MNIKIFTKESIAGAIYLCKRCFGAHSGYKNNCRVLLYHSVGESDCRNDTMGLSVSEDVFYMQMKYLRDNKFFLMSLPELVDRIKNNVLFPDKSIAITFDDGYRSILTKAFPILKSFGFSATAFINVYFTEKRVAGDFYWERWDTLSWDEVAELHKDGLLIGSHALSHRRLGELSIKELEHEISISRDRIESRIKERIDAFSYPHGSFNKTVKDVLRRNKFTSSCASIQGCVSLKSDIFALRRTEITSFDNTSSKFQKKLLGCYDWLRCRGFNAQGQRN